MDEITYRRAQRHWLNAGLFPPDAPATAFGLAWLAYRGAYGASYATRQPLPATWGLSEAAAQVVRAAVDKVIETLPPEEWQDGAPRPPWAPPPIPDIEQT